MRLPPRAALLFALAFALAACDSQGPGEPDRVGVSGRWTGTLRTLPQEGDPTPAQQFPVDLTLADDRRTVTGQGTVDLPAPTGRLTFLVTEGLYDGPSRFLTLTLVYQGSVPGSPGGNLSGNVSAGRDEINGTMSGPGLANGNVRLTLNLQRAP